MLIFSPRQLEAIDFEIVGEDGGQLPVLEVQRRMRNKGHV